MKRICIANWLAGLLKWGIIMIEIYFTLLFENKEIFGNKEKISVLSTEMFKFESVANEFAKFQSL